MRPIQIRPLCDEPSTRAMLQTLLVDTVAQGGSVSFMHPLDPKDADAFWAGALAAAARGARIVLGAWDGDMLVGTVTLLLEFPPNQPHRAEIAKMMTRTSHRRRGIARELLCEAERLALAKGRTHLMLDTASEDGASALYESLGYRFAGEIPDFALKPMGGLTGTRFYWKRLAQPAE
jgi:ribosomal protein S18 acetylase RimI-like enzyme